MSSAEVNPKFHASWRHPFQNLQICMDSLPLYGLAARALRFADRAEPAEVGGLLWGKTLSGADLKTILIQQAEFVGAGGCLFNTTEPGLQHLCAALGRPRNDLEPVGYFRTAVGGDILPRQQDRAFIESKLDGPDSFALIIEPLATGTCNAHFYFLQGGRLQMQSSPLQVPLVPQSLNSAGERLEMRPLLPRTELVVPEDSQVAAGDGEFPAHSSWSVGRTVFVTVLLLAMVGVSVYRVLSSKRSTPAAETATGPESPIGLQVERRPDGQLDLNWNRAFARIAGRDGARLSVTDGSYVRTLELTQDQLLSGKLAYFPRSDDIRFHLEMSIGRNRTIGESIRVVSPEVYASSLPAVRSHQNAAERARAAIPVSLTERNDARSLGVGPPDGVPALSAGAGIVKTDTPGTYILASRPAAPGPGGSGDAQRAAQAAVRNQAVTPNRVPEQLITATPPPINAVQTNGRAYSKLIARIATPQSLSLTPPPAPSRPEPEVTAAPLIRATRPPPVTEIATPVYQVMPNTKPFGYSLVNNDVQVDVEVHIDENGVVRQADPVLGRAGRSTMLTAQALMAARKWRFKPAEVDGRRVPSTYVISFKFHTAP
jgi:TonB family protein